MADRWEDVVARERKRWKGVCTVWARHKVKVSQRAADLIDDLLDGEWPDCVRAKGWAIASDLRAENWGDE